MVSRQRELSVSTRDAVAMKIKEAIQANPIFEDHLDFPSFGDSRLQTLVNQSLNVQHSHCKKEQAPKVVTLFSDHSCESEIVPYMEHEQITKSTEATTCKKVVSLLYTNKGMSLLAIRYNDIRNFWEWQHSNTYGKLWHPTHEIHMENDTSHGNLGEAEACTALSKNGSYVAFASGGKVSFIDTRTFKIKSTFMAPPPAVTFIVFHPRDSKIIVFGMEDSTIQIYDVHVGQVINKLEGHKKKITGLSFSQLKKVLVSSSADAQLWAWSIDNWEKKHSGYLMQHPNHPGPLEGDTTAQFHNDCRRLLVVNASQLAIYNWKLEFSSMWAPGHNLISSAVFSSDGLLVYAASRDGTIKIFDVDLTEELCKILLSSYVTRTLYSGRVYPIPMVVAVRPKEPKEMAIGMSNGEVIVLKLDLATWKAGLSLVRCEFVT